MFKRTLQELAIGTLFSSDAVAGHLREHLLAARSTSEDLEFHCLEAVAKALDKDYPRQFRLDDIRRVVMGTGSFLDANDIPVLGELFDRLMMRNGDHLQYRERQVQAYARLAADIDPTLVAGWHLAKWISGIPEPRPHDVERVVGAQLPMFAPPPIVNKPYAEGHVHLGGVLFDGVLFAHFLTSDVKGNANVRDEAPGGLQGGNPAIIDRLRRVLSVLMSLPNERSASPQSSGLSVEDRLRNACDDNFVDTQEELHMDARSMADACILTSRVDQHWLLYQVTTAITRGSLATAWLWLVIYLWWLFQRADARFSLRVAIAYLFVELMNLRRQLIMDGQGLTRFTRDYFGAELRRPRGAHGASDDSDTAKRILLGDQDVAEIKIGPDSFKPKVVGRFARAVSRRFAQPHAHLDRIHICAHWLRSKGSDHKKGRLDFRKLQWKTKDKLLSSLQGDVDWLSIVFPESSTTPELESGFQFPRWLRGLDVAGNENTGPIELFAPVLRALRIGLWNRPEDEMASTGFHLSIHAGEDYAHPLSGMRHVDETVRFCEMRGGDRIGHALALGILPAAWATRQGDMILPVHEHLDNLVWMWHYACELSSQLPLAGQVLPRLERRIARFAGHVAWIGAEGGTPVPETLFKAWLLRRNCRYKLASYEDDIVDEWQPFAVPDFDLLIKALKDRGNLGSQSHAVLYLDREDSFDTELSGSDVIERGSSAGAQVLVRATSDISTGRSEQQEAGESAFLYDVDTPAELEFMHALQDYLLGQYDRLGLIIETNPTSNVYIARLENHAEHPIFRWNPPDDSQLAPGACHNRFGLRRGPIQVLINTDDPGIMPTTLRMEYALLLEAGVDLGYSRTAVETWLERIRIAGMDQFYRNHLRIATGVQH